MPYFIRHPKGAPTGTPPDITAEWRTFLDVAPAMIWLSDTQGRMLHVNAAWRAATGLSPEQITPSMMPKLVHPDDRSRLTSDSPTFSGSPYSFEFRLLHSDGSYRWVLERIQPWRGKDGRLLGYIGSAIDIQAQKEHEQRLAVIALRQTSLTYFSRVALVQSAPEEINREALRLFCENLALSGGLLLLEENGLLTVVATRGVDLEGMPPCSAEGALEGIVLELPGDAESFPVNAEWLKFQGWADGVAVPVDPQNPRVGYLVGLRRQAGPGSIGPIHYARDLAGILAIAHERWRAERKLREGEERALQVQKMEAVGLLAGGVAHDFNNLLTAIRCFADLLRDELHDPSQRLKIDDILHASSRASHLVRQLLAFSRHEVTQPEDLDLNRLLDDLRGFIRSLLSEHVRIEVELAERPAWCRVDRKQIEQILFNLCLNARDIMTTDGVLTLRVSHLDAEHRVRLSVADTGAGIPPEVRSHLFEPFYTTKARGRGTGLGLATCLGIARAFGGTLNYETELGRGTVFHLDLPEIADPLTEFSPESESEAVSARARILLVEDDDLVRAVTMMLAESLGHSVVCFPGSMEALEYAKGNRLTEIDVLVTDIVMPRMNGHELASHLLTIKPGLPVFYMSGYVDDPATVKAMAQPGVFFLSKPFSSEEFGAKLAMVLSDLRSGG